MVRCRIYFALISFLAAALGLCLWHGRSQVLAREASELPGRIELVRTLQLTDLALWTEARYTRHPSQADRFTPFQDFPAAPEHFPAGSVLAPPPGGGETTLTVKGGK